MHRHGSLIEGASMSKYLDIHTTHIDTHPVKVLTKNAATHTAAVATTTGVIGVCSVLDGQSCFFFLHPIDAFINEPNHWLNHGCLAYHKPHYCTPSLPVSRKFSQCTALQTPPSYDTNPINEVTEQMKSSLSATTQA